MHIRIAVLIRLTEVAHLGMSSIFIFTSAFRTFVLGRERPELGRVAVFCEGGPSGVGRAAKSDFSPLSEHQGIFDVNAEVPDGVLDLRMPEQDLDRAQVPSGLVDH